MALDTYGPHFEKGLKCDRVLTSLFGTGYADDFGNYTGNDMHS